MEANVDVGDGKRIRAGPQLRAINVNDVTVPVTYGKRQMANLMANINPTNLRKYEVAVPRPYDNLQIHLSGATCDLPSAKYKNPYKIEEGTLLSALDKMRVNFDMKLNGSTAQLEGGVPGKRQLLMHAEDSHHTPIASMGDYSVYDRARAGSGAPPLREVFPCPQRLNPFGSPFKTKATKSKGLTKRGAEWVSGVDEVGEEDKETSQD